MKLSSSTIGISIGALICALGLAGFAFANPSFFMSGEATATATSSVTYMRAGTGTTTLVQRAYVNGNTGAIDSATLKVQFTGSSTASAINIAFEYADLVGADCYTTPDACDWYRDSLIGPVVGTTTNGAIGLGVNSYNLNFASSTVGGASGISTRTTRLITVPTPAPFVRAVITMPIGSLNGAVWAQFLPLKESR